MAAVTVIGAGISGLLAGGALSNAGHEVRIVDKGRGVGGRLATRSLGNARFDHGAQFFTVRNKRFEQLNSAWLERSVTTTWCHGFGPGGDGHPRYIGMTGMSDLAKDLASRLDVRTGKTVAALIRSDAGWTLRCSDSTSWRADAVVSTVPVPQALALLDAGGTELDRGPGAALRKISYTAVLALMAVLDGPPGLRPPGGVQLDTGPFSWVGDNSTKGISPVPALTLHATAAVSSELIDDEAAKAEAVLLKAAEEWTGAARIIGSQLQRWRFAQPKVLHDERCLVAAEGTHPLVFAGDAFGEPRVEGAALSGWAAADAVAERLG